LNVTPTGVKTFLTEVVRLQLAHSDEVSASSVKACCTSKRVSHSKQRYTYVGMVAGSSGR
jgi:hypothetical protein